jgi:STE24 endopeptidase
MIEINHLLIIFITLLLCRSAGQVLLHRLNISHLRRKGNEVPEVFRDVIDQGKLRTISSYTIDSSHWDMVENLIRQGGLLLILLSGILPRVVEGLGHRGFGVIWGGLIFFALLSIFSQTFHLPFSLYDTFVIENRYGFNTLTVKMWLSDLAKEIAVSTVLSGLLLGIVLALVAYGGTLWWLWAWVLFGFFELLLLWLFPLVIAPLFNTFEPLDNGPLEHRIKELIEQVGLRVKGVFRMDASKRSKHTNAYFTGIGKSKRVVLFDTLLASHTDEEILSVLAHEVGHWKKRHVLKQIVSIELLSLVGFYLAALGMRWQLLYQTFGFNSITPFVGLFLVGVLISPVSYFVQPAGSAISRRFEREADDFSVDLLKGHAAMCQALKRLAVDNLANLTPHPLYAWFYYSHPPLAERIARLQAKT